MKRLSVFESGDWHLARRFNPGLYAFNRRQDTQNSNRYCQFSQQTFIIHALVKTTGYTYISFSCVSLNDGVSNPDKVIRCMCILNDKVDDSGLL
jgi:hypothetical protein